MRNLDCASHTLNTSTSPRRLILGMLLVSAVVLSARSARAEQTPRIFPLSASAPLAP
jgi:hypothetical protein